MKDRSHRFGLLVHILTVLVLLLKGADKLSKSHFISGGALVVLGLSIILLLVFEKRKHWSHDLVRQVCLMIESVALFIVALAFYQEGKVYLPYVFAACAFVYFVLSIVVATKQRPLNH